jgi:hypothetical protein
MHVNPQLGGGRNAVGNLALLLGVAVGLFVVCCRDATAQSRQRSEDGRERVDGKADKESYIGVFTAPISAAMAAQLADHLDARQGLLVLRVLADSPSAAAGLRQYDVLTTCDGRELSTVGEFKKLVVAGKAWQMVKIGLIRGAKPVTVTLKLAVRSLDESGSRSYANGVLSASRIVLGAGNSSRTSGAKSSRTGKSSLSATPPRNRSLSVFTDDGRRYQGSATESGVGGKARGYKWNGTLESIQGSLKDAPVAVRQDVKRVMALLAEEREKPRAFRLRIQPRIQGESRSLVVSMSLRSKDGNSRVFEIERKYDGDKPLDVDGLLKSPEFARELKRMSPAVRDQIDKAVRRFRRPHVRVGISRSQ